MEDASTAESISELAHMLSTAAPEALPSNMSNASYHQVDPYSCRNIIRRIPMVRIGLGFCSVGFLLNLLMVISMAMVLRRTSVSQKATFYFLINLAFSDTIWSLLQVIPAVTLIWRLRPIFPYCIHQGLVATFRMAPSFFLLLKTIDCYIYIVHGLTYPVTMTTVRARILCALAWVTSFVFTFLPAIVLYLNADDPERPCVGWDRFLMDPWFYVPTSIITMGPLLVIMILYIIVFYHIVGLVKRGEKMTKKAGIPTESQSLRKPTTSKLLKSFKATTLIILTFIFTWMPQCIWTIINVKSILTVGLGMGCPVWVMQAAQQILAYVNLLLDPIAYMWGYKELRKVIKRRIRQETKKRFKKNKSRKYVIQ